MRVISGVFLQAKQLYLYYSDLIYALTNQYYRLPVEYGDFRRDALNFFASQFASADRRCVASFWVAAANEALGGLLK
jgi:hypothetical protein